MSWKESGTMRFMKVLVFFLLGIVLISLLNFWQAVRPMRIHISGTPENYGLRSEDVTIRTPDGIDLAAWYIPSQKQDHSSALIVLHGYPANKADMLGIARRLHSYTSVLLVDLRYFGESGGNATTLGVKEPHDVGSVVRFLKEKGYDHVNIMGFSFGGAVALMTAADEPDVSSVVTYASYADLRRLGHDLFFILPGIKYPLVELMNLWSGVFFGGFSLSASPENAVRELHIPVLLVHSKQDEQIPFKHAERLQEALRHNEHVEVYFLEEGRHGVLPGEFYDRLIDFLDR